MRVVGAHIHSYRGIRDLVVPFGRVTVLIGRNGAGKSSVLEALGFRPSEEGALERRGDEPPQVSWYLAPRADTPRTEFLRPLFDPEWPEGDSRRQATHRLGRHVVARVDSGPDTELAFDAFSALIDHPRRNRSELRLRLIADAEIVGTQWSSNLAALLDQADQLPPFLPLGVGGTHIDMALPRAISMITVPDDISPTLLGAIQRLARLAYAAARTNDPHVSFAIDELARGCLRPLHDRDLLVPLLEMLERRVNQVVPHFVISWGGAPNRLITIDLLDRPDSDLGAVMADLDEAAASTGDESMSKLLRRAVSVIASSGNSADMHLDCSLITTRTGPPVVFSFSRLGTGSRRWICGAIDEATRDLEEALTSDPISAEEASLIAGGGTIADRSMAPADTTTIRLIDEPLESLEASTHGEVLAWLRSQSSERETLVLSSHHPSVLRAASTDQDLEVIGLERTEDNVRARVFGPSLLAGMRESFEELGLRREDLLFNARALLLVEGADDVRVLEAVYGDRLYELGVLVKALGGTGAPQIVAAFTHSGYELLGLRAWAMFDSLHDDSLSEGDHCPNAVRGTPSQLQEAAKTLGDERIRTLPFEPADICLGLTPHCYELAFPSGFRKGGRRISGKRVLAEMQECRTSADAKSLLVDYLQPDSRRTFSQAIITPAVNAIAVAGLGEKAANKWLRATMRRLENELSAIET